MRLRVLVLTLISLTTACVVVQPPTVVPADACRVTITSPNASYTLAGMGFIVNGRVPAGPQTFGWYPQSRVMFPDPEHWQGATLFLRARQGNFTFVLGRRPCYTRFYLLTADDGKDTPFLAPEGEDGASALLPVGYQVISKPSTIAFVQRQ